MVIINVYIGKQMIYKSFQCLWKCEITINQSLIHNKCTII